MTQRHYDCNRGPSELARSLQLDTIPTRIVERASSVLDLLSATDAAGPGIGGDDTPPHGIQRPSVE